MGHIDKPIDHYTGDSDDVNVYTVNPPVVQIHSHLSDVHHSMDDREAVQADVRQRGRKKYLREMLKRIGLFESAVTAQDFLASLLPPKKYRQEEQRDA